MHDAAAVAKPRVSVDSPAAQDIWRNPSVESSSNSSSVEHPVVDPLAVLASTWTRMGPATATSSTSVLHQSPQQTPTAGDSDVRVYSPEQYYSPAHYHSLSPLSSVVVTQQRSWTCDAHTNKGAPDSLFLEAALVSLSIDDDDTPPSIIHDEARVCNWEHVLTLCNTHPHLAAYTSPRESQTALHHACDRRCPIPAVFESLIRAFPEALVLLDQAKGWTPLHCACRFKAPLEAIELLLHLVPEYGRRAAQEKCKVMGRIPLFYAIRYEAPAGVTELLLQYIRGVEDILDKDKVGMSILSLIWDSWAMREGKTHTAPFLQQFERLFHSDMDLEKKSSPNIIINNNSYSKPNTIPTLALQQQLSKVELLLQGAFHYKPHGKRKWRFLHACAAINCHISLFMVACVLYPEQAKELDQDDLYLVETSSINTSTTLTEQRPTNQQTALHIATKVQSQGVEARKILMALLKLYPEAAAIRNPRDDCFPLHYLCMNESKVHWIHDGFRNIFDACRDVISKGNYWNQLPLHLAASVARYRPSPVIDYIHDSAAQQQQHRTQDAQNPLLQHATMDAIGSIIQNLIEAYPESSRQEDVYGLLPFHYMAQNSELWTLDVEVLYMSYPQVIHTATKVDGNLPLHLAARNIDARGDFIHALVKLNPSGCTITNHEGKLSMHLACESGKNWDEGVESIYEANKEALYVAAGYSGKLSIHFAAASKACRKALLTKLVERNSKSTLVQDSQGRTPLHLAIESGKFWDDGLDVLIQAGPDSLDIVNNFGTVPFVAAALKYCNHTSHDDDDDEDSIRRVETLYELLQRVPSILNHYRNVS